MAPMFSRAFSDSLGVFDQTLKAILVTLFGVVVTAIIVFRVRGWEGLKKHIVENIFIGIGGVVASWVLVFMVSGAVRSRNTLVEDFRGAI